MSEVAGVTVPEEWLRVRRAWFGTATVDGWLLQADVHIRELAARWGLQLEGFLAGGALSLPLACRAANGQEAVLKLAAPWNQSRCGAERDALRVWDGQGAVRLLACSEDGAALLLERLRPGTPLSSQLPAAQACVAVAELYARLPQPRSAGRLPTSRQQTRDFLELVRQGWQNLEGRQTLLSADHWAAFSRLALDWCRGGTHQMVHGDFQNKNLLWRGQELVVIDPAPAWADPLGDLANWALMFDPLHGVSERCALLAELLELNLERLRGWVRVQATCSLLLGAEAQRPGYQRWWVGPDDPLLAPYR